MESQNSTETNSSETESSEELDYMEILQRNKHVLDHYLQTLGVGDLQSGEFLDLVKSALKRRDDFEQAVIGFNEYIAQNDQIEKEKEEEEEKEVLEGTRTDISADESTGSVGGDAIGLEVSSTEIGKFGEN